MLVVGVEGPSLKQVEKKKRHEKPKIPKDSKENKVKQGENKKDMETPGETKIPSTLGKPNGVFLDLTSHGAWQATSPSCLLATKVQELVKCCQVSRFHLSPRVHSSP